MQNSRPRTGPSRYGLALGVALGLVLSLLVAVPTTAQEPDLVRVQLADTVDVAVDISGLGFPSGEAVDRVLLGRRDLFADSLAGGVLGDGSPLLLTDKGFLSDAVVTELERLSPTRVTILGGDQAIAAEVVDHLEAIGYTVDRLFGPSRIETAVEIAESVSSSSAILARAFPAAGSADDTQAFADSLPAGALAAQTGQPVLLTQTDVLTGSTRDHIQAAGYDRITIVGGTAAISQSVEDEVAALVGTVERVSGPSRFDTAIAINQARGLTEPNAGATLIIADGQVPDAWSAGFSAAALAAADDAPMVFTSGTTVPPATATFLEGGSPPARVICSAHPDACSQAEVLLGVEAAGTIGPIDIGVDPSITPSRATITDAEGNERPVAVIDDGLGGRMEFVADELVVIGDADDLAMAMDAAAGTMAESASTDELTGDSGGTAQLIRVDTAAADPPALADGLFALDPYARGSLMASSQDGLDLMAVAAQLAAQGVVAGPNIVFGGDDVVSGDLAEARTGDFTPYSRDPQTWDWLDGSLNFGVPDAWRALALTGNADTRSLDFGVMDAGFPMDEEIPPGSAGFSNIPNAPGACGGGDCPFHGFDVTVTAVGQVGNGRGTAGVAGPVASAQMVSFAGDLWDILASVLGGAPRLLTSDVINMSFSAKVPAILSPLTFPLDVITRNLARAGVIITASAGNVNGGNPDSANVDGEDCFIVCWEEQRVIPCELDRVVCVGGVAPNSTDRDPGSWFGREDVDLWAPFTVFVGPQVTRGGPDITDGVTQKSGTSFSAPYVAGAFLLVKAANPSAGAGRVLNTLRTTALAGTNRAGAIVQPYAAVQQALGTSTDPFFLDWTSPEDGATITFGDVRLRATVTEVDGPVDVQWFLNGGLVSRDPEFDLDRDLLDVGANEIRLVATSGPYTFDQSRSISRSNTAPTLTIENPADGQTFFESQTIPLTLRSFDPDESPGFELPDSAITWLAGGVAIGAGSSDSVPAADLGIGAHTITARGDDGLETVEETVTITVEADPANVPPSPLITAPTTDSIDACCMANPGDPGPWYAEVDLAGTASDPEDGSLSGASLVWTTTADENGDDTETTRQLGTGTSLSNVRLYVSGCGTVHQLTLTATDSGGESSDVTQSLSVSLLC
ncbi:cell wall-binding repeat-containing protein [Euzebya tangerina]|uniref:cell wall-binding repeat-containing protein n=1 Tax=Euzebya tangerina TaxID=591198 RepID=UPI000E31CD93|nr:cell wall-binding repeat-containing protein [Euzebya tangerina]